MSTGDWLKNNPDLNPNPKKEVPPREELFDLYWNKKLSGRQLGVKYKVSQMQICRWFTALNIPSRTYKENKMPTSKGKSHTWGNKISVKMKGNLNGGSGENHWHWEGGKTEEGKKIRNSKEYKEWRTKVFERDDYRCVNCLVRGGRLEADHIKPFCRFEGLRFDINNGRTLCKSCHLKVGWQFFKEENPRKKLTINS